MGQSAHPLLRRVGGRIRELRADRGWSQEELADRAKLDRSYMSGIERGVRNTSVLALHRIALALRVDVQEFFTSDGHAD